MPPRADILLTGLPRSGITSACHLLNHLPDAVALFEPRLSDVIRPAVPDSLEQIRKEIFETQRTLIEYRHGRRACPSTARYRTTTFHTRLTENQRQNLLDGSSIRIDNLQPGIGLRHSSTSSIRSSSCSQLPEAAKEYPCLPLSGIRSAHWSLGASPSRFRSRRDARAFSSVRHPARLALHIAETARPLTRSPGGIASWLFTATAALPKPHIIRYEDIIATDGSRLPQLSRLLQPTGAHSELQAPEFTGLQPQC